MVKAKYRRVVRKCAYLRTLKRQRLRGRGPESSFSRCSVLAFIHIKALIEDPISTITDHPLPSTQGKSCRSQTLTINTPIPKITPIKMPPCPPHVLCMSALVCKLPLPSVPPYYLAFALPPPLPHFQESKPAIADSFFSHGTTSVLLVKCTQVMIWLHPNKLFAS